MKKVFLFLLIILIWFSATHIWYCETVSGESHEQIPKTEFQSILKVTNIFLEKLSEGDTEWAIWTLSPKASSELKENIRKNLSGKVSIGITWIKSENIWDTQIKLTWTYTAKWENWNKSGFTTYFLYQEENGNWSIVDTDIYNAWVIWKFIIIAFMIIIPLFIFFFLMLINCAKKPNQPWKIKWLLIIILIPFWSLFYFFMGRKSLKEVL